MESEASSGKGQMISDVIVLPETLFPGALVFGPSGRTGQRRRRTWEEPSHLQPQLSVKLLVPPDWLGQEGWSHLSGLVLSPSL